MRTLTVTMYTLHVALRLPDGSGYSTRWLVRHPQDGLAERIAIWADSLGCKEFELVIMSGDAEATEPGSRPVYRGGIWSVGAFEAHSGLIFAEI